MWRRIHWIFCLGGILGLAASLQQLFSGAGWIRPYFYMFAWWFYLLFIDGANGLRQGRSRMTSHPARFAGMCLLSVPWWLFFEALNLRLRNWIYAGLPQPLWIRWPGYALGFATVLPAVLETADFLSGSLSGLDRSVPRPWLLSAMARRVWTFLGSVSLVLPLLYPRIFFPLVWGAVFLLAEPWLAERAPEESWLWRLSLGRAQTAISLLASGMICGLLWESLNFWAGAKWMYTLPWPRGPKIFEMPLLGYLGFAPFALECASFWAFARHWRRRLGPRVRFAAISMLALLSLAAFWCVDRWTLTATPARFAGGSTAVARGSGGSLPSIFPR